LHVRLRCQRMRASARFALLSLFGVVGWAFPAHAQPPDFTGLHGGLRFDEHVGFATTRDSAKLGGIEHSFTLGSSLRALGGGRTLALAIGLDLEVGLARPSGFAFDFTFAPLGFGVFLGRSGFLGVVSGVGGSGVGSRMPFAFQIPVEAFLDLDVSRDLHLSLFARVAVLPKGGVRDDGASHAPFGDELSMGLAFSFHSKRTRSDFRGGDPNYVSGPASGARYREAMGTHALGTTFGWMSSMQL